MPLPAADDGIREGSGIAVSLRRTSNGRVCLVLDDVAVQLGVGRNGWRHETFFTAKEFDRSALENLNLSKDELAEIGENILIRLLATNQ